MPVAPDVIALAQRYEKRVSTEPFQVWQLKVGENRTGTITCEEGNGKEVYRQELEFTDVPLAEITFYCTGYVILPLGEY
jgi:hypothetical protein